MHHSRQALLRAKLLYIRAGCRRPHHRESVQQEADRRAPGRGGARLAGLWESDRPRWDGVFDEIGQISLEARKAIEMGKPEQLGALMDRDHALLQQLTVSSPQLDRLVEAARAAGARGAKLSGGGRGGNMIALVDEETLSPVQRSLKDAGATHVIATQVE